jgi:hypothetical protein
VRTLRIGAVVAALLAAAEAPAEPFVPANDAQVLERLPSRTAAQYRQLKTLQVAAAQAPNNVVHAASLASAYLRAARLEGDPRYLGYAQGALAPWWKDPAAPTAVLMLRATILQSRHQFDAAVADLDKVSEREPGNAQARLTRATILTVQGHYRRARDDCNSALRAAAEIYGIICIAAIDSVTGKAGRAYETLHHALLASPRIDSAARAWGHTLLGEIAHRQGDPAAEDHFRAPLRSSDKDLYLLAAYGDWLIDRGRAAEAIPLLQNETRVDALLLRLALAQQALGLPQARASFDMLRARFDANRGRGDTVHQRESARFELFLRGNAAGALHDAVANWQVQREPADLLILAQAAVTAQNSDALAIVKGWLAETGLEYPAVAALVDGGGR